MTVTVTSGPQIQDFKVRNAIDQITTALNKVGDLVSIGSSVCSTVVASGTPVTGNSFAVSGLSAVAQGVLDIISALQTAKLMR